MTMPRPVTALAIWIVAFVSLTAFGPAAEAQVTVGGHIGASLPIVTTTTFGTFDLGDDFSIGFPMGITLRGTGSMAFDLELLPTIETTPRLTPLTIHPGLIWDIGNDFGAGVRAAFEVSSSRVGFTPLLSHSWPTSHSLFSAYVLEFRVPVRFNRPTFGPGSSSVAFEVVGSVSF
jgi:hypothetical protein